MTGREGEPIIHPYAFNERQLDIRHVRCEPRKGTRGIDNMLEQLGREGGEDHRRRGKNTVPYPAKQQQSDADDIREPLRYVRVIPIKYIARGRMTVTEQQVQVRFGNVKKRQAQYSEENQAQHDKDAILFQKRFH